MRLVALLTLALAAPLLRAEDPPLKVPSPDGTLHAPLVVSAGKKASVFFFVSPYCPTATTFAPEMKKIAADYAKQADFYFVHSDPDQKTEDILQHTVLNDIQSPVLLDKDQRLARFFTARITPETVVFSSEGKVVYQGRINDLYLGPTKRQRKATTQDLRDALDALIASKPVALAKTEAFGCKISGMK